MPIPKLSRHVYACILGILLVSILPALGAENAPAGWPPADESGFQGAVTIVSVTEEDNCGIAVARVPYLGILGDQKTGLARVVVPLDRRHNGKKLPAFCHVHYEKDLGGQKRWAKKGWAYFTAAYTDAAGESPIDVSIGNGYNLARAIIQWARRCGFTDPARLHIDGGSQGGYMALAMAADMFPVTSVTADCPVVNWAYNIAYIEHNRTWSCSTKDPKESPLPVLGMVTMLADMAYAYFPRDLSHESWYLVSPISALDRITAPVLIIESTGDMLVPMEQFTDRDIIPWDKSLFPEGYERDFLKLTACEPARKRLEDLIPPESVFRTVLPPQEGSFPFTRDMVLDPSKVPDKKPDTIDRPWSPNHQWNLCYMNEGPPLPHAGHNSMFWSTSADKFIRHYQRSPVPHLLLTPRKLEHLLRRWSGNLEGVPVLNTGAPANRLNYPDAEKRDVESALRAFAECGAEHVSRLRDLYQQSPIKPWGDALPASVLP
ncbi:MAG TPA: prolyl oligopeptidase family serine peptidase [Candidatus Hydrogenedentes bacterium]|mgnify:CR=1 FL=1|nr:prolyl oligopeptidase family serine peptidase [Candidatus Hydrogenedentota bacterium]